MTQKKNIVVLYGGKADEHSISCISTAGVLNALDTEKFNAIPVGITKQGQWIVGGEDPRNWSLDDSQKSGALPVVEATEGSRRVIIDPARGSEGFLALDAQGQVETLGHIDAVFPVLHGPYGEDGTVQGLLEMMGVPYVGCGVLASSVCMDKHYTKEVLRQAGIRVAEGFTLDARIEEQRTGAWIAEQVHKAGLQYPLFVKPSRAGSSFGVTRVDREEDAQKQMHNLELAVAEAAEHDWRVLIEQGVNGREIECAVLAPRAGEQPRASWPGEVVIDESNTTDFYDFDSKYMDASASHVEVPAHLPEETLAKVQEVAVRAFNAVDGFGLSRVDTFVTPDGEVLVNEINTMPGFTPISMYSKAWEATGLSYSELITQLLEGVIAQ
ncbi:D-alanine--D-alanine ligase family protein [Alloscardovia criceti]|uniref:D-alanine--D-alanine ligase family protein n=1 Tax=Alloscardovia criceti TaxID=356828 RepID=UPI0003709024|nr:D-alanine--D-alanine ligase family protein [Alloscardovia criceti]